MDRKSFLMLKAGDVIELPMDQRRTIEHGPNKAALPWNQVASTTEAWFDRLSGTMTFLVEFADVVSIIRHGELP